MTNEEEIKHRVDVMQAFLDGELVLWRLRFTQDKWLPSADTEVFNWEKYDFQVKPKPREIWVCSESYAIISSEGDKIVHTAYNPKSVCTHYREVLDDEE